MVRTKCLHHRGQKVTSSDVLLYNV